MDQVEELKNAALGAAAAHIRGQRDDIGKYRFRAICVTVVACVALVCAAVVACVTIRSQQQTIIEQQYALNGQYWELLEYVKGLTVTVEETTATAEADGDGSISVAGDGNITAGGDVNGE